MRIPAHSLALPRPLLQRLCQPHPHPQPQPQLQLLASRRHLVPDSPVTRAHPSAPSGWVLAVTQLEVTLEVMVLSPAGRVVAHTLLRHHWGTQTRQWQTAQQQAWRLLLSLMTTLLLLLLLWKMVRRLKKWRPRCIAGPGAAATQRAPHHG